MKYIKPFYLFETKETKILYHASPYKFGNFKNRDTFFSDTEKFAKDYADQKSSDYALDAEANIYTVEINAKIFNINKEEDCDKLENILPDKIKYVYNNFGFSAEEDKEEFIFNLKGFERIEPFEDVIKTNVGETFPNPEYRSELYIIIYKDIDNAYALYQENYNRNIYEVLRLSYDKYSHNYKGWVKEIFNPLLELMISFINNEVGDKYEDNYKKNILYNKIIDSKLDNIEFMKKYHKLFKHCEIEYRKTLIEKQYCKKFTLKPKTIELSDTWRFYENETVIESIKKLGYCGYVAKEKSINTYNIFNPSKSCKIISYEFPSGFKFKSIDEYNKYLKYMKIEKDKLDDNKKYLFDRWECYKDFKDLTGN